MIRQGDLGPGMVRFRSQCTSFQSTDFIRRKEENDPFLCQAFLYSNSIILKNLEIIRHQAMEGLHEDLQKHGQEHLLKFVDVLSPEEKVRLVAEIKSIDIPKMVSKFHESLKTSDSSSASRIDEVMKPPSEAVLGIARKKSPEKLEEYRDRGLLEIAEGRVGVALLAGGQGTRLGVNYPKGMYDVGLPSHKTLYQLQAERILRLQNLAEKKFGKRAVIPWYIMTSGHTKGPTFDFFKKHNFFGLAEENVLLFGQGEAPCFTFDGKIILEEKGKVSRSPDGNGGIYGSLRREGVLRDMQERKLSCIHVYCVDNILVKVADPTFIGYCLMEGADCAAKVVPKAFPDEPVGVVCEVNGKYQVVEYSEIMPSTARRQADSGELLFSAANICNHFFSVDFLDEVSGPLEDDLEYHVAKKKIPFAGDDGKTIKPTTPNGIKIEKFVFDVFKFAETFRLWEAPREEEFSPVKNADGAPTDTPTTARQMYYSLCRSYIEKAGGKFEPSTGGESVVEISPLVSYDGEDLASIVDGKTFGFPCVL